LREREREREKGSELCSSKMYTLKKVKKEAIEKYFSYNY
jgi:hypothetical protein